MSDGHFNRAILPRTDYQSGWRAGQARARHMAEAAFTAALTAALPQLTEQDRQQAFATFREMLSKKE